MLISKNSYQYTTSNSELEITALHDSMFTNYTLQLMLARSC